MIWVSEVNKVMLDFWRAMASCFLFAHLTKSVESWLAIALASAMLGTEASNVKSSAEDVMSWLGMGQSDKVFKEGLRDYGSLWDPAHTRRKGNRCC